MERHLLECLIGARRLDRHAVNSREEVAVVELYRFQGDGEHFDLATGQEQLSIVPKARELRLCRILRAQQLLVIGVHVPHDQPIGGREKLRKLLQCRCSVYVDSQNAKDSIPMYDGHLLHDALRRLVVRAHDGVAVLNVEVIIVMVASPT